jgi:hypothetical protein
MMRPRIWLAGGLVLLGTMALGLLFHQHNQMLPLKREIVLLTQELPKQQTKQVALPRASLTNASDQPLTAAESLERLKLRAEFTQLKQQNGDLAEYERWNRSLAEQVKALGNKSPRSESRPERPFIPTREVRMLGTSGPEEAFQSFVYALVHRDTNVLGQVTGPAMLESLMKDSHAFEKANIPEAFQIRRITRGVDHAELEIAIKVKNEENTESVSLELVDGGWRMKE